MEDGGVPEHIKRTRENLKTGRKVANKVSDYLEEKH